MAAILSTSVLASLVCGCESDTHCPIGLRRHFRSLKRNYFVAATPLASRSREWTLLSSFRPEIRLYSVFRDQPFSVDNKTRWRSHVIGHLPLNRNWSFLVAPSTKDGAITTYDVSSAASMTAWLFVHKKLLVMCARTGCPKRGKRWGEQFNRSGNARRLRKLRQRRKAKRWTTRSKSTHQKRDFKCHPSNARMTGRPRS